VAPAPTAPDQNLIFSADRFVKMFQTAMVFLTYSISTISMKKKSEEKIGQA
jgi:hypothetical protein